MNNLTYENLLDAMLNGTTIITPNHRLSRHLLDKYYTNYGSTSREKPACLAYQSFNINLFNQLRHANPNLDHPVILTFAQQRTLWRKIIGDLCGNSLLDEVMQAWTRCQIWGVDLDNSGFEQTPQTRQLKNWSLTFQQELDLLNVITEEQIVPYIQPLLSTIKLTNCIWVCFDDFTPQQLSLQKYLATLGYTQEIYDLPETTCVTNLVAADDPHDETLRLIDWLQIQLKSNHQRIGVIVPDLQNEARELQRHLERYIDPALFNISLGQALSDAPLVAHALTWLLFDKKNLTHHQMRLLLHSPFLNHSKREYLQRSQIMKNNILQEENMLFSAMIQTLQNSAPNLALTLNEIVDFPEQASPHAWALHFKTRLKNLGFPGEYSLDSTNYQYFQRLMNMFDEFTHLALTQNIMTRQQALDTLVDLAQSTIFQIRTPTKPIQICGLLEASGCTFDSIWVKGLTDSCLPQKTNFSAFIPIDIQREYQMPYSSAARELQLGSKLLNRLQYASLVSIFSYPSFINDTPQSPSPLIEHLPILFTPSITDQKSSIDLIVFDESYNVPLLADETVSGGTSLLEKQAQCPFKSFAAHRLHASKLPETSFGPNLSERGQLIHRCLEILWGKLHSQQQLLKSAPAELEVLINSSINQALEPLIKQRNYSFSKLIQEVEYERLQKLIYATLEWEKQRPAFIVKNIEQTFSYTIADINLQVRIDRIDCVENEYNCVIDYKTSLPSSKPWGTERLEHPQLPLYACLDSEIKAVLFLQLKAGKVTCMGLCEQPVEQPGIFSIKPPESWQDYTQVWHDQLHTLATEFKNGLCTLNPIRDSVCNNCDFMMLCRRV